MKRESINPVEWGIAFHMDQAEVVEGHKRLMHCSGQVALREDPEADLGLAVIAPGDVRGQTVAALANIDAILEKAGMTRANILHLRFFTTDIDAFLANYDVYSDWIGEAGTRPPQTLLQISRLVNPDLMVEIEAVAAQ